MGNDRFKEFDAALFMQKIDELYRHLEISYMLFSSDEVNDNRWSSADIEKQFLETKYYRIEANDVYTAFRKHGSQQNAYECHRSLELDGYWNVCKNELFSMLRGTAEFGGNKYVLNNLLKEQIGFARNMIDRLNLTDWIGDKDPNNKEGVTLLKIHDRYEPFILMKIDITKVLPLINHEFGKRRAILFELLIELTDIYSRHLLLPSIDTLPQTAFHHSTNCSATDMYEIIFLMERYCRIDDFEKLKAVLLQMLDIPASSYAKSRSAIQRRKKGKFAFLKKIVIKEDEDF